jgi:hypothetical protein
MIDIRLRDTRSTEQRVEDYLRSKPDREIAALLLQEVLPEVGTLGHAGMIVESAIDRLLRSNGNSLKAGDGDFKAGRVALEESDASSELFQYTF